MLVFNTPPRLDNGLMEKKIAIMISPIWRSLSSEFPLSWCVDEILVIDLLVIAIIRMQVHVHRFARLHRHAILQIFDRGVRKGDWTAALGLILRNNSRPIYYKFL